MDSLLADNGKDATEGEAAVDSASGPVVGDRVEHQRIGRGRVVASIEGSSGTIITIRFDHEPTPREFAASTHMLRVLSAWEEGRISPPWAEIDDPARFIPPLTRAERDLAQFLDEHLDAAWRIYVRPHLDADRPIIAAVHPSLGGLVWDVVPWQLDGVRVRNGMWHVPIDGEIGTFVSPSRYLDQIRSKLYGTYLPAVGEAIDDRAAKFSLIRGGLYFPQARTRDVLELMRTDGGSGPIAVLGSDGLSSAGLDAALGMQLEPVMQAEWFDAFDRVLSHAQRQVGALAAIRLTRSQNELAAPAAGLHVIQGVAGGGKSIVLVYRAARIAAAGRRVLVLTYNRTLTNYLRTHTERVPLRWRRDAVSLMHFHELVRLVHAHHGEPTPSLGREGDEDELSAALEHAWPASAIHLLDRRGVPEALRFDAVLVDEGQDISTEYAEVVRRLLPASGGELVIAHDPAQRIYDRSSVLSDAAHPWSKRRSRTLRQGVRLSTAAATAANRFAARWSLPTEPIAAREAGLLPESDGPFLIPVTDEPEAASRALDLLNHWRAEPHHDPGSVTVLVPSREFGIAFVRLLAEAGISTNHVFPVRRTGAELESAIGLDGPDWLIERTQKSAFVVGDARLKVSTIHSFKGWDSQRVIFIVPPDQGDPPRRAVAAVYVGITRAEGEAVFIAERNSFGLRELGLAGIKSEASPSDMKRFAALSQQVRIRRRPGRRGKDSVAPMATIRLPDTRADAINPLS